MFLRFYCKFWQDQLYLSIFQYQLNTVIDVINLPTLRKLQAICQNFKPISKSADQVYDITKEVTLRTDASKLQYQEHISGTIILSHTLTTTEIR